MPDITMCTNVHCPSAMICYRFTALPNEAWQSYALMTPRPGEPACDGFVEVTGDNARWITQATDDCR